MIRMPGADSWAAVAMLAGLLLQAGPAAAAPASAPAALPLVTPDNSVRTLRVPAPGVRTGVRFRGGVGRTVTVEAIASRLTGAARLELRRPDGTLAASRPVSRALTAALPLPDLWVPPVLDTDGLWALVLRPDPTVTRSLDLLLTFTAEPVGPVTPGTAATVTLPRPGLVQVYTVPGLLGRRPTLTAGKVSLTPTIGTFPGLYGELHHPDGSFRMDFQEVCDVCDGRWYEGRDYGFGTALDSTGSWLLAFRSGSDSVGSMAFTLRLVADQVHPVAPGPDPVVVTVRTRGQNAWYPFPGTAGVRLGLDVPARRWGSGGAAVTRLYRPDGSLFQVWDEQMIPMPPAPDRFEFLPLDVTGRWFLEVDPVDASTGTQTMVLGPVPPG